MAFTLIRVTGTYQAGGQPCAGQVIFTLTVPMSDGSARVVEPQQFVCSLDSAGRITFAGAVGVLLEANNDPSTVTVGATWTVREQIAGSAGARPPYLVVVPYNAAGGTIDLALLVPALPTLQGFNYALVSALTAETARAIAIEGSLATDAAVVHNALLSAKGDVIAATAPSAPARLAVGADATVLTADSTQPSGVKWASGYDPKIPVVLRLSTDGINFPNSVNHGNFWPTVNLGGFLWEFWCRYDGSTGYLISEGNGGNHAILFGFSPNVTGNIWSGAATTSFTGDYTPQAGEWLYASVGWDSVAGKIYCYINGIPVGITAFAGPRQAQAAQAGLYIGGSDHQCLTGCIAQARGWEGAFPLRGGVANYRGTFTPERAMDLVLPGFGQSARAQFLAHYMNPTGLLIADQGVGYNGGNHPGRLRGAVYGVEGLWPSTPGPIWVSDPTCPMRQDLDPARARAVPGAPATPGGAKIFDSFSRADTIPLWSRVPTLGSTEAGSLGPLVWSYDISSANWAVFDGRAVACGTSYQAAWVANNSADMDVRVDRRHINGLGSDGAQVDAGIAFRVQDGLNMLTCWAIDASVIRVNECVGAISPTTTLQSWAPPNNTWTTLRVVTSGINITVYIDNGAGGWITVGTLTSTRFQTAVGAGLYNYTSTGGAVRWDNFTVL